MPSSKQRVDVWNGRRLKTSGGLTKDMLVKNKRGKEERPGVGAEQPGYVLAGHGQDGT